MRVIILPGAYLKMQVGAIRHAAQSHLAYLLTSAHQLPGLYGYAGEMTVKGEGGFAVPWELVLQYHQVAVVSLEGTESLPVVLAGEDHLAIRRGMDGRAAGVDELHAVMHLDRAVTRASEGVDGSDAVVIRRKDRPGKREIHRSGTPLVNLAGDGRGEGRLWGGSHAGNYGWRDGLREFRRNKCGWFPNRQIACRQDEKNKQKNES